MSCGSDQSTQHGFAVDKPLADHRCKPPANRDQVPMCEQAFTVTKDTRSCRVRRFFLARSRLLAKLQAYETMLQ